MKYLVEQGAHVDSKDEDNVWWINYLCTMSALEKKCVSNITEMNFITIFVSFLLVLSVYAM